MGSNGKIALPKDAEGREIPLDTKVLYDKDGNELRVKCVEFDPFDENWRFILKADSNIWFDARYPRYSYLEKPTTPDSWEKLLDDMERAIHTPDPDTYASITCGYFDSANMDCAECERKHDICRETCNDAAWVDITARIHKLMVGEGK